MRAVQCNQAKSFTGLLVCGLALGGCRLVLGYQDAERSSHPEAGAEVGDAGVADGLAPPADSSEERVGSDVVLADATPVDVTVAEDMAGDGAPDGNVADDGATSDDAGPEVIDLVVPSGLLDKPNSLGLWMTAKALGDESFSPPTALYSSEYGGYCIQGTTTDKSSMWGAVVSMEFFKPIDPVGYAWQHRIKGFTIAFGYNGIADVRVAYDPYPPPFPAGSASPSILAGQGVVKYQVADFLIADAVVPSDWAVNNPGAKVEDALLYAVQVQVVGGQKAGPFALCVYSVIPILDTP